ncbi:MAG: hypothetical protein GTN38_01410 [Candidatus Aenigmarchaeota archaeon]|nr:hypothetical protein [Candidatus Aenigmarchaeota archaeon]NIQ17522.1 hypothetical protein [Candidatus Aenigmarchaeota archaeon]NIS73100.1 hypothetical protein [Candidatus Aenigmarchaeota archaeon]
MSMIEEKLEKIKAMHTSNFVFWILGKFLLGLGIGILLPVYFFAAGWMIAGWMLVVFAIILQIPAMIAAYHKRGFVPQKKGKI